MAHLLKAIILPLLVTFLIASSKGDRNIDPELQWVIDSLIQNAYLPMSNISGMGLAIVQNDGELLYTTGYGMADQDKGIPNSNTTQFLIGSSTKSVTSTVVVKVLHEKFPEMGEAVLDTPIRKLLPQVNFTLIDRFRSEQASFRDLLAHRLCIFRDDLQLMAEPFDNREEIMYRQRYNEEICNIRTQFQYNNQMYVIAGELAGIIAGKSYEDLVQDLLTEIGMNESALTKSTDDFSQMPNRGQPYYVMDNVSYPINPEMVKRVVPSNAAGGLFLTPNDMAKYLRFRMNLGKIDGKQVVPEDCMKWMNKIVMFMDSTGYKSEEYEMVRSYYGYGMGLMIGDYNGWQHIQHGGYFPPYHSLFSIFPGKNLSIFTSTNMGPALIDAQFLHEALFRLITSGNDTQMVIEDFKKSAVAHIKKENEKKDQKQKNLEKIFAEHANKPMSMSIVGKYGSGSAGDMEIIEKLNEETNTTGLYLSYGKWFTGWVEHESGDIYKLMFDSDAVQDNYAGGSKDGWVNLLIANETVEVFQPIGAQRLVLGKFKLGVSLDILPPVPWSPDSCGPE